ncbi:MAG TPA: OsmC family protein [Nitrospira sp.]|nr:OsmC family protein [Nitrospira sp.]
MSEHAVGLEWKRESADFTFESYNRDHLLIFGGGITVPASSAPQYRGNPARVNPEEGLVAALSSCHMLTFLAVAAKQRLIVDQYQDHAVGFLEMNENGRLAVSRVILRPRVTFGGPTVPTDTQLAELHQRAHRACFIANSVKTQVTIEPAS